MTTSARNSLADLPSTQIIGALHDRFVHTRRVRVLAEHLASLLPPGSKVLDVGCGDGMLDVLVMQKAPDISIQGIDVLVRPSARIPVSHFDGIHVPYADKSFDVVLFVDVLHHVEAPAVLLQEAKRVSDCVLIKDHFRSGLLARTRLRLMDWVGNAHHGVPLPYNYWSKSEWLTALNSVGLKSVETRESLGLYAPPASWLFERGLHFISWLEASENDSSTKRAAMSSA